MKIGIIPHTGKSVAMNLTKELVDFLQEREVGCQVILSRHTTDMADLDLLIVLGGDGTLLNAARLASVPQVPVFGVNVGHLDFLTEFETDGLFPAMERLLNKEFTIEERMLITASVHREGQKISEHIALNDFVITRGTF